MKDLVQITKLVQMLFALRELFTVHNLYLSGWKLNLAS